MKSRTSATPRSDRYRVTRIAVSGTYICLVTVPGDVDVIENLPPF